MNTTETALVAELAIAPIRISQAGSMLRLNCLARLARKGVCRFVDGAYRLNAAPKLEVVS